MMNFSSVGFPAPIMMAKGLILGFEAGAGADLAMGLPILIVMPVRSAEDWRADGMQGFQWDVAFLKEFKKLGTTISPCAFDGFYSRYKMLCFSLDGIIVILV